MKRALAIILVAVMCLTSLPVLFVSASAETAAIADVENIFEFMGYGKPNGGDPNGEIDSDYEYITGKSIPVTEGDVISMAPVIPDQGYHVLIYKNDGKSEKIKATNANADLVSLGDNEDSPSIFTYKVPAGVTHVAPVGSQMYTEYMIVTKNQTLTKEICFDKWSLINANLNAVNTGYVAKVDEIVNLLSDGEGGCGVHLGEATAGGVAGLGEDITYRATLNEIPVTRDDVIYFVGETPAVGYSSHYVTTFLADGSGLENYKHANISVYAELGNGYVVYAYRPYPEATAVRITAASWNYDMGIVLVTKNQPFDGTTFRLWCKENKIDYVGAIGEDLDNLFTATDKGGAGILNAEGRSDLAAGYGSNTNYWCTEPIAVTTNDTLYFVGVSSIGYHVSLFDKDGKGLGKDTNVKPADLTVVEELGKVGDDVYNIYSYTPTAEVGYVRISQKTATYESKCVLLTKNQPFDKVSLDLWCVTNGTNLKNLIPENTDTQPTVSDTQPVGSETEPTVSDTQPVGNDTTPVVTDPATTPTTTVPEKKSCGGFAGVAAMIAVGITVFGAAITVVKKK